MEFRLLYSGPETEFLAGVGRGMQPALEGSCLLAEQGSSVGQSQVEGVTSLLWVGVLLNAIKHLYVGFYPGLQM